MMPNMDLNTGEDGKGRIKISYSHTTNIKILIGLRFSVVGNFT